MPIEIRELVIKATVQQDGQGAVAGSQSGGNNDQKPNEEILNTCLEKINEIIREKNER